MHNNSSFVELCTKDTLQNVIVNAHLDKFASKKKSKNSSIMLNVLKQEIHHSINCSFKKYFPPDLAVFYYAGLCYDGKYGIFALLDYNSHHLAEGK